MSSWGTVASAPDSWMAHRERIHTLYITEKRKLREVQEVMVKEHNFVASIAMYKKKLQQWNMRANRKGWASRQPASRKARSTIQSGRTIPVPLEPPLVLKLAQSSFRMISEDVNRCLRAILPLDYKPLDSTETEAANVRCVKITVPLPMLAFGRNLDMAMDPGMTKSVSAQGAYFEKAFDLIKPALESDPPLNVFCFLWSVSETYTQNYPEIREILLNQVHAMCTQLYGKNHRNILGVLARHLLQIPDEKSKIAITERFAKATSDIIEKVLGPYANTTFSARARALAIATRLIGPESAIDEWELLQEDCHKTPYISESMEISVALYYTEALWIRGEYDKIEVMLRKYRNYPRKLRPDDSLDFLLVWSFLGAALKYAQAAHLAGKNDEADETFTLAIAKATELHAPDEMVCDLKVEYSMFLKSRGQFDEADRLRVEIEYAMKDFMLQDKCLSTS